MPSIMEEYAYSGNYAIETTTSNTTVLNFLLNSTTNSSEEDEVQVESESGESVASIKTTLDWIEIALILFYCSIIAATVIGNTLVIVAVITTRRLRTITNCFVMSLALADWLVGIFVMPIKVFYHLSNNVWKFGSIVCKIWTAMDVMLCTSSILSLCIISIDRYLAITRPLEYSRRRRSKRLALSMIACVWVGSFAITTPPMFGWLNSKQEPDVCEYEDDPFYVVYSALGSFFVPLLVMIYVYARIAFVIARRPDLQKVHKSKQKGDVANDTRLTVNRGQCDSTTPKSTRKKDTKTVTHVTDTMTFSPPGQSSGTDSKNSSPSSWNPLLCLRHQKAKKTRHKTEDIPQGGRVVDDGRENTSPNEIPSPSTLHSIGIHRGKTPITQNATFSPENERTGLRSGINGTSRQQGRQGTTEFRMTSRTGSRLCNHNITNSSPPISIIPRNKIPQSSSSAARPSGFTQPESEKLLSQRVWTIDIERRTEEEEQARLTRSAIALNGGCPSCTEERVAQERLVTTNSADDLHIKSADSKFHFSSTPVRQGLWRQTAKVQSHSCSHLVGTATKYSNSQLQVIRSKSVKIPLRQQLSDNQTGTSKEFRPFAGGRVASFKRETKAAQTLAVVVGGFICCWLPFFTAYVLGPFIKPRIISGAVMEMFVWLGWGNSAINPAIYAFYNPDFRSAFYRLTIHKCNGVLKVKKRQKAQPGSPKRYDQKDNQNQQNSK